MITPLDAIELIGLPVLLACVVLIYGWWSGPRPWHAKPPAWPFPLALGLAALLAFAAERRPDLTLLTGDITQRARAEQFRRARAFADQLPAPVLSVPGNHDLPLFNLVGRLFNPYGHYRNHISNELEPVYESSRLPFGENPSGKVLAEPSKSTIAPSTSR